MERTIKGHTKAVMDVDYDSKGDLMGESMSSHLDNADNLSDLLVRLDDKSLGYDE